ncbi:MAG: protease HtpX, partial [Gammaproteobacteria bacterium]
MKRIALFLITNLAVVLVLSIVMRILGIDQYIAAQNGSYYGLLVFAAVFGFGGALISLAMSKWSAKRMMGVRVIEQPRDNIERWLVDTVRKQAGEAGIGMPEVGIFDSPEPNAFATGANKNKALVAVSTGLLQRMRKEEVEAVLGHEVGHVANGDMVTLTLIQGVVNTFVIFLARVIGNLIERAVFKNENGGDMGYFLIVIV